MMRIKLFSIFILLFIISCTSVPDKYVKDLENTSNDIISKTEVIKKDVKTIKTKVVENNCSNTEIIEQINDVELKLVDLEGQEKLLKKEIEIVKTSYKSEIKNLESKLHFRSVLILLLLSIILFFILKKIEVLK